jgi:hypothetical protein
MGDIIKCSICNIFHNGSIRYPNAVCYECIYNYTLYDKNGNKINFYNIDESGGVKSVTIIGDTKIEGNETICFINGNQCSVEEGRFGGIVITLN